MLDHFGHAAGVCANDGNFAGHGLERREAEGFKLRGKQEKVRGGQLLINGVLLAEKEDVFLELVLAYKILGGAAVGAVADEHELGGHFRPHKCKDLDGIGEALDGTEVRKVHENRLAVGCPVRGKAFVGGAAVQIAVHKVRNDFDGAFDVELFQRFAKQVAGNAGNAVALLDGKLGDGKIAAVAADERDVRAMQRGNKREAARRSHRAREQRAHRMRNGIMHVEKVERFRLKDFEHFGGKRQRVGRMVKERVGNHLHFVKVEALTVEAQADGRCIANEVDLVAARGELDAELRGDDAGAAVSEVASDADAHGGRFVCNLKF